MAKTSGDGFGMHPKKIRELIQCASTSTKKALNLGFVKSHPVEHPSYDLYYFTTNPPTEVIVEDRSIPCLPLALKETSSIWIAVEIRVGREGLDRDRKLGQHFVQHTSIKCLRGDAGERATVLFRAEWDARDIGGHHAQPHWNIHHSADAEVKRESSFENYLQSQQEGKFGETLRSPSPPLDFVRMHFALASTWQKAGGSHSAPIQAGDDLTRWIEGCCTYIREQFEFITARSKTA